MQIFVMRAMATGQNWVFRYFNPALESQQEVLHLGVLGNFPQGFSQGLLVK